MKGIYLNPSVVGLQPWSAAYSRAYLARLCGEHIMTANAAKTYEIDVEDVEYLRHGDKPLLARLFKPRGTEPFPLMVDLHGGAWCRGDRLNDTPINEPLAKSGVVVVALDFRMPPEAPYPASLADINYAIRWLKTQATALGSRPDLVGILGSSSGGHQAMLAGMRPHDPRYAALPLPAGAAAVDASLRCVVMCWPVIDPLGRYSYAKKLKGGGKPYPELVDRVLPLHDQYWQTEEAMAEGNPVLALERGERVELPPVLYLQGTRDIAHPRPDLDRFVMHYRRAGGQVELELFEGEAEGFINRNAGSPAAGQAIEKIIEFVHKQVW
jgi:acetyl esterase